MREVTITEAKNALTALVHQAEAGKPTRLTRRGKPVAVLLSEDAYHRLQSGTAQRRDFWDFVERWRADLARRLGGDQRGTGAPLARPRRGSRFSRPHPFVDGQIAAIAAVSELVFVTRNVSDFDLLQDLTVKDWASPR